MFTTGAAMDDIAKIICVGGEGVRDDSFSALITDDGVVSGVIWHLLDITIPIYAPAKCIDQIIEKQNYTMRWFICMDFVNVSNVYKWSFPLTRQIWGIW